VAVRERLVWRGEDGEKRAEGALYERYACCVGTAEVSKGETSGRLEMRVRRRAAQPGCQSLNYGAVEGVFCSEGGEGRYVGEDGD